MKLDERSHHEIEHGRHLVTAGDPELLWNWATPAGRVRALRRGRLLAEAAGLRPGLRALEVGCGTGLFTEIMAAYGAQILAVDISPDLLALARARNLPAELVEWRAMRFEDGAVDGPFDAIVGSSVLHHLDMIPALRRMRELLKPGGVIAFAEPNMLNPQIWAERHVPAIRRRNHASPDETAIVRWSLARALQDMGYSEVSLRNIDWLHPAVPAPLISAAAHLGRRLERMPIVREFSGSVLIRARRPLQ